jgi:hypothetical protein
MDTERTGPLGHQPGPSRTGDSRVDEAIAGLAGLGEVPLDEHPPVLEAVHDRLREILGELGEAGGHRPARPGEHGSQGQLSLGGTPPRIPPAAPDGGPREPGAGQGR